MYSGSCYPCCDRAGTVEFLILNSTDFRALHLWAAALPLLTANICYAIAIGLDHVPACFPYISGCTTVSSTGRLAPESLLFKAGMLPAAVMVMLFWRRCSMFLESGDRSRFRFISFQVLGIVAALSITLYTLTLGIRGDDFRLLRRIGIDGFALSNFTAQVMFVLCYRHMRIDATKNLWRWLLALCLALPVFAVTAEIAKWAGAPRHPVNNIVAWNALVVLCGYFAVVTQLWQRHELSGQSKDTASGHATSLRLQP